MTESSSAGFTPASTNLTVSTPQATNTRSLRNAVPDWVKYATFAFLGLAGLLWLLPQYKFVGEEYHIWQEYTEYHNLGTVHAGMGYILGVWLLLIAAAAGVGFVDKPGQLLGRFAWMSTPLILFAMILVRAGRSALENTVWYYPDDRNWTNLYGEPTTQYTIVWVGLWAGLIGATGALIYSHFYKPTPGAAATAATMTAPVPRPVEPQQPPVAPKNDLEQELAEIDRLHAANTITDDERTSLREHAFAKRGLMQVGVEPATDWEL